MRINGCTDGGPQLEGASGLLGLAKQLHLKKTGHTKLNLSSVNIILTHKCFVHQSRPVAASPALDPFKTNF